MDCFRWARKEVRIALFPRAKEYQKLSVGAYNQEEESESEIDLYTADDSEESPGTELEEDSAEDSPEPQSPDELHEEFDHKIVQDSDEASEVERNWWDSERSHKE
jgi:hypothetical protein